MIFGRKSRANLKDAQTDESAVEAEEVADDDIDINDDEVDDESAEEADDDEVDDESAEESDDEDDDEDRWAAFDASRDWRDDGPFDVDEVELEGDDVPRLDLGSLIVTPSESMQLQITADPATQQGISLLVRHGESAFQVTVWAAPTSDGYASEVRDDISEETLDAGGSSEPVEGPFGTELRRTVPVQDEDGSAAIMPVRDWFAQGPRWLLTGRIFGVAAMEPTHDDASEFEEFFRNLIVRRGEEAMAPGSVIPLTLPGAEG